MTTKRTHRSAIAILTAVSLLLVACGGDDDAADPTTTTTVEPEASDPASTTPTSTSEPSDTQPVGTSEPTPPPSTTTEPIGTADSPASSQAPDDQEPDWLTIVRGLRAVQTELWESPDVGRILEYCSEPSPCLDRDGSAIANLADQGHHAVDFTSVEPLSAELVDTSDDAPWDEANYVTVRVSGVVPEFPSDAAVVDAAGAVVFSLVPGADSPPAGSESVTAWTLTKASGEWRVFETRTLDA